MREKIKKTVHDAFNTAVSKGLLPEMEIPSAHQVSPPRQKNHGDFSSNIALISASAAGRPPRQIAEQISSLLKDDPLFEKIEIAGPGFINFFVSRSWWQNNLLTICNAGDAYGESNAGRGIRVQVEFVSANPTGPLHVGHGRGAAVGDSLARVLRAAGFDVDTEYYINDVGNQMRTLGKSVYLRYQEYHGVEISFPEDHYQGAYIRDIARGIAEREGDRYLDASETQWLPVFRDTAVKAISSGIRRDLADFDVHFDHWFSERVLYRNNLVEKTISELQTKGFIYEKDGALWFRTTEFNDEKDRVVKRSNGVLTYFASDIAYHRHKLDRGYDILVDIWGADHHGYVPRVRAALKAMGHPPDRLRVLLVQLVNLMEAGKPKAMSTRAGEFVTLREVLNDVGSDAARFMFLTRRCDSHLDFDLELARKQSQENPVYYVQYAHARLASVLRTAKEQEVDLWEPDQVDLSLLDTDEETDILKQAEAFPGLIADSALALEPHRISYYLSNLAGHLHSYYNKCRFISEDQDLTQARLLLARVMKRIFRKGLNLLGVSAPEKM